MFSRIITTEIYSKHVTSLNAETGALQFLREKPIQNWKKKKKPKCGIWHKNFMQNAHYSLLLSGQQWNGLDSIGGGGWAH